MPEHDMYSYLLTLVNFKFKELKNFKVNRRAQDSPYRPLNAVGCAIERRKVFDCKLCAFVYILRVYLLKQIRCVMREQWALQGHFVWNL
jgi:hypothetical protein